MRERAIFCPVETTLLVIAGKWKLKIIYYLCNQPKRFNQLQRDLEGITHRSLSKQLKEMEADGLVRRIDYEENPPRVEYCLSELGKSLDKVLKIMAEWGEKYNKVSVSE